MGFIDRRRPSRANAGIPRVDYWGGTARPVLGHDTGDTLAYRILFGDPARSGDAFGLVGISAICGGEYTAPHPLIRVAYARRFGPGDGDEVFAEAALAAAGIESGAALASPEGLRQDTPTTMVGIETNGQVGREALAAFRARPRLAHTLGVATCGELPEGRRLDYDAMDKPYTVGWLALMRRRNLIRFPASPSPEMRELITQLVEVREGRRESGAPTYSRRRSRHDDLFSALLGACHLARVTDAGIRAVTPTPQEARAR